jgi:coiled-coil and C2 domain-containing protein 2A
VQVIDRDAPPPAPPPTIAGFLWDVASSMVMDCASPAVEVVKNALSSVNLYGGDGRPTEPNDNLFYNGSYLHEETQQELSFYASDDTSAYIKLMITLDPLLLTIDSVGDDISASTLCREDRPYASYANAWMAAIKKYSAATTARPFSIFCANSSALNVLVCRYLTGMPPPEKFSSRRAVLHLVSSVPFMKDAQSFIGSLDLWCTSRQFWEIGAGDEEEHATMLYNYLYYLLYEGKSPIEHSGGSGGATGSGGGGGASSSSSAAAPSRSTNGWDSYPSDDFVSNESMFLVLGNAVPEGKTTYVLMRDTRRRGSAPHWIYSPECYLVINPCSGHVYSAIDPSCPLKAIYCIATPYNVWANIQDADAPYSMVFDVRNTKNWRAFFSPRLIPPIGGLSSVQHRIIYRPTDKAYALEIEKNVTDSIRNQIRKLRHQFQK